VRVAEHNVQSRTRQNLLRTPIMSLASINRTISDLYRSFVKNNPLIANFGEGFRYVTGGMAVKLATQNSRQLAIRNTYDYDVTVAINKPPQNNASLRLGLDLIKKQIHHELVPFLSELNRYYNLRASAKLKERVLYSVMQPRPQDDISGRQLYQVLSYDIEIPGKGSVDFMDVAFCYIPGINDNWIDHTVLNDTGFPVLRRKYLLRDIGSVLVKSFLSREKLNTNRNPITGPKKNKGLKNIARMMALVTRAKNPQLNNALYALKRSVNARNVHTARANAEVLYNELRRIR